MDKEIKEFISMIDAREPEQNSESYQTFRKIFKRQNYFIWKNTFIIVKISRNNKPFWGVGKDFIDFLNSLNNYYLILLTSGNEGWVFNKSEVNYFIDRKKWNLRNADNNYKINPPLPDKNSFFTYKKFMKITSG